MFRVFRAEGTGRMAGFSRACAWASVLAGLGDLAAWWSGRPQLSALGAGPWPMAPNTGLNLALAGTALLLLERPDAAWRRRAARAAALVMAVIGAATLGEYLLGFAQRVDFLLLPFTGAGPEIRPSPYTAASWICVGAALAVIDAGKESRARPSDILALIPAVVGLAAVAGYGFGVDYFYVFPSLHGTPMALSTAAGLIVAALGIMAARPGRGLAQAVASPRAGGLAARRLLAAALIIVPALAALGIAGTRLGLYPATGAVSFTMLSALIVMIVSALRTARVLDGHEERREAAERALRSREEQLRDLIDQASDAIFVADLEGRYTTVNAAACRMLGYSREELIGKSITDLIRKEETPRLWREKEAMSGGRTYVSDWDLLCRDGAPVRVEISAKILPDGRWQAIVRDVSERRRREDERVRLALESAANAMLLFDSSGVVRSVNQQAAAMFGCEPADLLGRPVASLLPELAAGPTWPGARELTVSRPDGARFPAEVGVTALETPEGRLNVASIVDVSELKRSQEALKESEARLRRTVSELESFAYTVSHNLRAPLRALEGYARIAEKRLAAGADGEARAALSRISAASSRLDRMIRDLLSYSAVGWAAPATRRVDLDEAARHAVEQMPPDLAAFVTTASPLGAVFAQESLLLQALSNLLSNALKFVPASRAPRVEVFSRPVLAGRRRLIVRDNGIGIEPGLRERIFEPFETLHARGGYEGTGIGLAIVRRAVEKMGGRVGVDSQPGMGSEFWVELPEA